MSFDKKPPHPIFSFVWVFWWVGVLYYNVLVDAHPFAALLWLVGFFNFEVLALKLTADWTLSRVVTWCIKTLSHHDKPFHGWNNLAPLIAFPIAALIVRVSDVLIGGPVWWGWFVGAGLAIPVFVGLEMHWRAPARHG